MNVKFGYPFWSCGPIGGEKKSKKLFFYLNKTTRYQFFFFLTNNWILTNESAMHFAKLERDGHCIIKTADDIWPSLSTTRKQFYHGLL